MNFKCAVCKNEFRASTATEIAPETDGYARGMKVGMKMNGVKVEVTVDFYSEEGSICPKCAGLCLLKAAHQYIEDAEALCAGRLRTK